MLTAVAESQPEYTFLEEFCNYVSHGIPFVLALFKLLTYDTPADCDSGQIPPAAKRIMLFAFMVLYGISTLYHALTPVALKAVLRFLDHLTVVVFMLGTTAPLIFHGMPHAAAVATVSALLLVIASFAYFGVFFWREFTALEVHLYVAFATVCCACTIPGFRRLEPAAGLLFVKGALAYASGIPFFLRPDVPYMHSVFHCCVVLGSVCHYRVFFAEWGAGGARPAAL